MDIFVDVYGNFTNISLRIDKASRKEGEKYSHNSDRACLKLSDTALKIKFNDIRKANIHTYKKKEKCDVR